MLKGYTKQEISWMMYDWANSAHSVIIVTLLPIFFDTVAGYTADSVSSMSTWGYATSIAMLIVALAVLMETGGTAATPPPGDDADQRGLAAA